MKLSRRNQTIAGFGLCLGAALLMVSGSVDLGAGLAVGIVGIVVLGSRPDGGRDDGSS